MLASQIRVLGCSALLFVCAGTIHGQPAQNGQPAQKSEPAWSKVISAVRIVELAGENVSIPIEANIAASIAGANDLVTLRLSIDVSAFQSRLEALTKTILPNDSCQTYSNNNTVFGLDKVEFSPNESNAQLTLSGPISIWQCLRNPVPNSRVEMVERNIGGLRTKVPVVVTYEGAGIKTMVARDTYDTSTTLWVAPGGNNIDVRYSPANSSTTRIWANSVTTSVNQVSDQFVRTVASRLKSATDVREAIRALPGGLEDEDLALKAAKFVSRSGKVFVEVEFSREYPLGQSIGLRDRLGLGSR